MICCNFSQFKHIQKQIVSTQKWYVKYGLEGPIVHVSIELNKIQYIKGLVFQLALNSVIR